MPEAEQTVFVVDDDVALCEAIQWLLESEGLRVRTFPSAEAFLARYDGTQPGCLVLDLRMRGMDGLTLLNRLGAAHLNLPVIVITGHGDVPTAVKALKGGALDFLEKPVDDRILLERIRKALQADAAQRSALAAGRATSARIATLTRRELEVLHHVVDGQPTKQIALELGVTQKTIEAHRKRIMQKMGVHSAVALTRLVLESANSDPEQASGPWGA